MLATSSFSLVLAETIIEVFVIDSEELQGIAVNLGLSERRAVNLFRSIVLTYHRLDGGAYGLCGVWSIVLLDLLKEVTEVVVSDVFPQWFVAQQLRALPKSY